MTAITACRSCASTRLAPVIDLGATPLANSYRSESQLATPDERFPLAVVLCCDCSLVQITESVPPEKLFREYLYFSSFSDAFVRHAAAIAERLVRDRRLGAGSLVVEVASNDGYLLQAYHRAGVPVLGIEPASNIAKVARERGIPTIDEFFGDALADRLRGEGRLADVVHANNVLAHVPDLNGVVAGFRTVLKPDGVVVVEAPYLKPFLDHVEFDTIYHEHLCYFSLTALDALFRRHGLIIRSVERLEVHGGSLRVFAEHAARGDADASVARLLAEERGWGVSDPATYARFAARVQEMKGELRGLLDRLKGEGKRIAAYGAAAKGSTLLNFFGIDRRTIEFVADRSTYKQGRFMPGVAIPIVPPQRLLEAQPDYLLVLAWNFADEIMQQQRAYHDRGGRFIVPIPRLRVV